MSYAQSGTKRAKVREGRAVESLDYFQGIEKIEYNNMAAATDTTSYRYYHGGERLHSKPMEDWLKYSVAFTDFKGNGFDNQGRPMLNRPWNDNSNSIDNYKRCIRAFFDFCLKLGVKYWTAFDTDLVPFTDNLEENKTNCEEITEYLQDLLQKNHLKVLWIAPDLHSHLRYTSGAMTSPDASTYVFAAAQTKKCLEMSQRLNAECFLLWPYREGYDVLFQTDLVKEIKLFAKLLKATAEYRDKLSYKCQLLVMPYNNYGRNYEFGSFSQYQNERENETLNKYMWDVTSCLCFLKNFNLDRHYKILSPPGHHLNIANVYSQLGGVMITHQLDQFNNKSVTLMMKSIINQGAAPPGGIHLRLSPRRDGDVRELVVAHVRCIDAGARGLRVGVGVVAEQGLSKHMQQRYASYGAGLGARVLGSDVSLEECEEFNKKNQVQVDVTCQKTEHYNLVLQRYLDSCDHV